MSDLTVARRYAAALYEEAKDQSVVERIDEDMNLLDRSIKASRELVQFFRSPLISNQKKDAVVKRLFEERVHPLTHRLLQLMVTKEREAFAPMLGKAYRQMRDEQEGIIEAAVRVATPLNEEEQQALAESLESVTGKKIRLRIEEDPSLIGGLVVRVGDTVYDGSVRHQLKQLRSSLKQGVFSTDGQ